MHGKTQFKTEDVLVAILVAAVTGSLIALFTGSGAGAIFGAPAGVLTAQLRRKYLAALQARIDQAGVEWDVEVNDVKVGTISDADYARIRLAVFTDWRVYVAQLANVGWCLSKMIDAVFIAIPLSLFWLGVLTVAFAPEQIGDALRELQAHSPAEIVAAVRSALWIMPVVALLYAGMNTLITGTRFGFVNRFAERCDERVRRRLGVPTVGQMYLIRYESGQIVFNDEAAYMKGPER